MKWLIKVLAVFALLTVQQTVHAQPVPRAIVNGRVVDDSTRAPIPLANVFISNSTIGTGTDSNGRFKLREVPLGSQQVVASIVGYLPGSVMVLLGDSTTRTVEIRLKARPVQMPAVEIEARDPAEWRENLKRFLKTFFGSTTNSSKCKLLNPEVLDFLQEVEPFVATAREPLEIDNRALGYHIRCVLVHFSESREIFQFIGLTAYSNLRPRDQTEAEQWKSNRRDAFYGSKRHFLLALLKKNTREEGFEVNRVRKDFVRNALRRAAGSDVNPDTLLTPGEFSFQKKLSFADLLQVVYTRRDAPQISLIEMGRPQTVVYANGQTEDPLGLWTYGYWSSQRFADLLPLDYEPE
jgi:hypothetical protein